MIKFFIIVCLAIINSCAQHTEYSKCKENAGDLPMNAYLKNCTKQPCIVPQRQDAIVYVSFRPDRNIKSMRTYTTAYSKILGVLTIPMHYNLKENAYTCDFLDTPCPLKKGQLVNYKLHIYIKSIYPVGTQMPIEMYVRDQDSKPVFCVRANVRVGPPVKSRNILFATS